ncbi:XRE family transcriptional regulator [Kribbella sp. NPDC050820]|uniref:helix-turn-helix domain-containing protein n=1 Tax=Kribbella sp. NPDC050820 TaxID=3155408 RepID=UPI00340C2D7D
MSTETNRSTAFIEQLGGEVRRRRQADGLTVQALADRAGLSRRMLTQIEQGTANPSLVTVDKIAEALGVDFATLTAPSTTDSLQLSDPVEIWRSDAGSRAVLHVAASRRGGPELWEWTLQPGDRYDAQSDPPGSEELLLVTAGALTLTTDNRSLTLAPGQSARLASDRNYSYAASSAGATFTRVVTLGAAR